jgi:organic hydroperoxide reductase OsmC/OhrA
VAVRGKRFELTASVDRDGTMRAEGGAPVQTPAGWTPDHLLLAAVARCSLGSLRYHARRAGLSLEGAGEAHGTIARREEDGRHALVEVTVALDVRLDPPPAGQALQDLLAKAERDCFVGASLRAAPSYAWTVNGVAVGGAARRETTTEEAA